VHLELRIETQIPPMSQSENHSVDMGSHLPSQDMGDYSASHLFLANPMGADMTSHRHLVDHRSWKAVIVTAPKTWRRLGTSS